MCMYALSCTLHETTPIEHQQRRRRLRLGIVTGAMLELYNAIRLNNLYDMIAMDRNNAISEMRTFAG